MSTEGAAAVNRAKLAPLVYLDKSRRTLVYCNRRPSFILGLIYVGLEQNFQPTVEEMAHLTNQGCTLVDTTCGSVLNVWKNVVRYAQDGYTAIIHGKVKHEETRATASQALKSPQGRYLVVLDREEAGAHAIEDQRPAAAARVADEHRQDHLTPLHDRRAADGDLHGMPHGHRLLALLDRN